MCIYVAASQFKGHPQGDKVSETKKIHPKHDSLAACYDVHQFFAEMLEPFALAVNPKTKHVKKKV